MLKTTWGVLDPPVGNTRLNVVRLVASLLQTNTHLINQELINLNMLGIILVSLSQAHTEKKWMLLFNKRKTAVVGQLVVV